MYYQPLVLPKDIFLKQLFILKSLYLNQEIAILDFSDN